MVAKTSSYGNIVRNVRICWRSIEGKCERRLSSVILFATSVRFSDVSLVYCVVITVHHVHSNLCRSESTLAF
jgi:hypothetical protein